MDWRDQGILLSVRPHGETSAIIEVLTREHGLHAGVVRGGVSRRMTPILQPGAELDLAWRARLEAHIGAFTVEPLSTSAAVAMGDRLALAGLNAVTALLRFSLPEREAHPRLYEKSRALLDMLGEPEHWPLAYLHWELALLDELGFGLDLTQCAVLGREANDLSFVSPKSGRAVSRKGAGEWADRLLPLPRCLIEIGAAEAGELVQGFAVTGHFLAHHMAPEIVGRPLPDARQRFVDLVARRGGDTRQG
ncbi:DNA repair protein RecO [Roseovarius sp. SCSIO 43702]|uniref:DNA repair protein RecO n=1 Tax=Roseovarius sp. SCSIO 43702 TaxID=2823043 RepID=UPI001C7323D4|nr:DNA repair protein RecO [Roseovarius sp. SCSIO 43702]QYX58251.1 DNA repair protein RecO [Roseovarius sp. SCSIO 43702]